MTAPALSDLRIENLRGAVMPFVLAFEKGKKLTIVYGENGTGKSTIADALDLLGNGSVGSLENRGVGGVTRPHWPSVGKAYGDVKVVLTTSAGKCTLSLGARNTPLDYEQLRPQVAILRRGQILNLIAAQPADRYKEISKFVDVSAVEASEASLRKLIKDKENAFETETTRLDTNKRNIEHFWNEAENPASDALAWAQTEIQKDQQELDRRRVAIGELISHWDKIVPHPDRLTKLSENLNAAQKEHTIAQTSLNTITKEAVGDCLEVLNILKSAQQYFSKHPHPSVCPLCESDEKAGGLVTEVNRRIQAQGLYSKLETAKNTVKNCATAEQQAQQRLDDFRKEALDDFEVLKTYCDSSKEIADLELPAFPFPVEPDKWAEWIGDNNSKREGWRQTSDACVDRKKFVATLRCSLKEHEESNAAAKDLETILPRLRNILKVVEDERKKYTSKILGDISARIGELYEDIHPGEGMNKIVLALDAAKRGSLDIATEFGGKQDVPPQAYFSDSHLDTLGLCIFIALAEREVSEQKILVLDDVLGSVDEPHVDRIIGMVYSVSQKFRHTIVTTHYGPWRHKYRWGWLKNGQCQFVELSRWSLDGGISHSQSIPETERLRVMLNEASPDHQSICSKAGVILEAVLDFLTRLYECSVPRKTTGNYTLGDLLHAINSKLRKALRVEHRQECASGSAEYQPYELEPHLAELIRIAQVRNVMGCHFNTLSFDLLDSDAIAFGKEVLTLADVLIDYEFGWPMNDKSGSYWATAGETRRLYPLRKPG